MKWPGIKLGSRNFCEYIRSAKEVAEDNAIMSSPSPDKNEIKKAISVALNALIELESAIIKMIASRMK